MLPRELGDAGQVGDCVEQIQYARVFEHCRVHQATRRVGSGGSTPLEHRLRPLDAHAHGGGDGGGCEWGGGNGGGGEGVDG